MALSRSKLANSTLEPKLNVQVAVRVRPLNADEEAEKASSIVKVDNGKKQIHCKNKVYGTFDEVFSTQSTQESVYDKMVRPQVDRVLQGFNCTVFAYGQTGTGKTFTMEGGRADATSADEDNTTGMTPRAIETIFAELQNMGVEEHSVRASYVELYNEELFDLMAANTEDRDRLRIYDDPTKKGAVVVSGAEEVIVRNRQEVYDLLKRGAERRTTASTLMNRNSSRSHSIFTITVVVRECNEAGEEMVKTGKLNLVDLAGSEHIGRSGAEGKRAKEAGNINQSLLTLGRVITALTSNAPHIPYRESKLTRLLQDSLGGSTITAIIATVSPASSNFEETMSTLDYAMRAKSIKNHPECNQKVSRKALFKEYNVEIEKLRRDLRMAREKNGIYLSEESYQGMEQDIAAKEEKILEITGQMDIMVKRMQTFMENMDDMDEQYNAVFQRNRRLESKLGQRVSELDQANTDLATTRQSLAVHIDTLKTVHCDARTLMLELRKTREVVYEMQADVEVWWKKHDCHKEVAAVNKQAVQKLHEQISQEIPECQDVLDNFALNSVKEWNQLEQNSEATSVSGAADIDSVVAIHNNFKTVLATSNQNMEIALSTTLDSIEKIAGENSAKIAKTCDNMLETWNSTESSLKSTIDCLALQMTTMSTSLEQFEHNWKKLAASDGEHVDSAKNEVVRMINEEQQQADAVSSQMADLVRQMNSLIEGNQIRTTAYKEKIEQHTISSFDQHVLRQETAQGITRELCDTVEETIQSSKNHIDMVGSTSNEYRDLLTSNTAACSVALVAITQEQSEASEALKKRAETEKETASKQMHDGVEVADRALERVALCLSDNLNDVQQTRKRKAALTEELVLVAGKKLKSIDAGVVALHSNWTEEDSSEALPDRDHHCLIDESAIPRIPKKLTMESAEDRNVENLPVIRTRESLLDVQNLTIMSPASLAAKQKSRLEAIGEENII